MANASHPALQASSSGSIPSQGDGQLDHPQPQEHAADSLVQDRLMREDIELGLHLGNVIWSAVHGR
jgi:hypothetical protein